MENKIMGVTKNELDIIRQQQIDFKDLAEECNHDELGQCAKLLAMYVSIYKKRFGDLPTEKIAEFSKS
jgi:hypothetical protein